MELVRRFFATDASRFAAISRIVLGIVMFPHGMQKLLGLFGGPGFNGTIHMFDRFMHLPVAVAVLVILGEGLGSVALILGLATRLAALGITCNMLGAILLVHKANGFFMNWTGTQHGEGFEYHLLALAISIPLVMWGAGAWSVDRLIARRLAERRHEAPTSHAGPLEAHA